MPRRARQAVLCNASRTRPSRRHVQIARADALKAYTSLSLSLDGGGAIISPGAMLLRATSLKEMDTDLINLYISLWVCLQFYCLLSCVASLLIFFFRFACAVNDFQRKIF